MPQVKEYFHDVDLKANQLFNSRLHNITTADRITLGGGLSTADKGYQVYDIDLLTPFFWDGGQWNAASSITIPTLQEVTTVGNITTDPIYMGGLYVYDSANGTYANIDTTDGFSFTDGAYRTLVHLDNTGLYINNVNDPANVVYGLFQPTGLTDFRTYSLPDATGILTLSVNGNFADKLGNITISGVSQNLQQVTDQGASTTNSITLSNTSGQIILDNTGLYGTTPGIQIFDTVNSVSASINTNVITLQDFANPVLTADYYTNEIAIGNSSGSFVLSYPSQSGTFALTSDLSSYLTQTAADFLYYPLSTNPAGYLTSATIPIPTLQQVLNFNHELTNGNNFQGTGAGLGNTGQYVIALGDNAAANNSGFGVVSIGSNAGYNNTGQIGLFIGPNAGSSNSGFQSYGIGYGAATNNSGDSIIAIGNNVANTNSGDNLIAIGTSSGYSNTGDDVISLGYYSAYGNIYNNVTLIGKNATATANDQIVFSKSTSPFTSFKTRLQQTNTSDILINIPDASGTFALSVNGQPAGTDGNITIPVGTGTVTAVTATSPLFSSGGTTPNITIQQASGSQAGYLSSTNWTTFNSKEPAITAGTTSQYWRGDKTWQTFPTIPTVGTWGTLDYPAWTTGTPFVKMDAAGSFTLDTTSYQPLLTNPITGTGSATQVAFWDTSSSIIGDNGLWWDNTNKYLGIGTNTPTYPLHVNGAGYINGDLTISSPNYLNLSYVKLGGSVNAFGLDYATFQATSTDTGTAIVVVPNGNPAGYGYDFQFIANQQKNQLLFVGDNTTQAHYIHTDAYPSGAGWPLIFGVAPAGQSWNVSSKLLVLTPTQRVGIGNSNPQVRLHVGDGGGSMGFPYEESIIERNGDTKFGVYTSVNTFGAGGSAIVLGATNITDDNGYFPGFEFQFSPAFVADDNFIRYNFIERDSAGGVAGSNQNIFNIYANGRVSFQTLAGGGTQMVVTDNNGFISTQAIPGGGGGITSLNGLSGATQTFTDDTNITIVSSGTAHAITWAGTLADSRIASASTWNGKQAALSGTGIVKSTAGTISYLTDNTTNWDTAYTDRNKWDGGATGLVAATGRTSLGLGTFAVANYPTWISGTPFVKMTAAGTFSLDTNTYLTSITSSDVTTALGYTPVTNARTLTINGTTQDLTANRTWSVGDVVGPSSATDNAIVRFDTTTGKLIQNSGATLDDDNNITANSLITGFLNTAASGTQIVLTKASVPDYVITGSGGQTFKLPDATTLAKGTSFSFNNNQTSGAITVNNNSNTLIVSIPSGAYTTVTLLDNAIAAGSWDYHDQAPSNVSWSTNTFNYGGSITSAQWNGTTIAYNRGGTGQSSPFVQGGIMYGSSTSALASTAAGTSGQVLISNGTSAPTWGTVTGFTRVVSSVNSNTAAGSTANTDYVYLVSGTTTVTLPAAAGNTNLYTIKRVGTNTVSIATTAGTIDGSASPITITRQYVSLTLVSDGTNWNII